MMSRRASCAVFRAKGVPVRTALGLLVVVLLAGCSSASPISTASVAPLNVLPKGAARAYPSPPKDTPCNATASEAPPAVMPAVGQMPSGSFMAQIQRRGYIKVGVTDSTYLWGYHDPGTGELVGFDIDILRQIAQAIFGSSDPKYFREVIVSNADREKAVKSGKVDILAETMTINCERRKSIDFSSVYYWAGQTILVPVNSSITGPQDLGGKRVCAAAKSTSLQNLVAPGMPRGIRVWQAANNSDCLVMLQQNQVDAVSTDDAILLGLEVQDPNTKLVESPPCKVPLAEAAKFNCAPFSSEPYGLAISKSHPNFTSFVNGVLAQVRSDGTWTRLYQKYLLPHLPAGSSTPAPPAACYVGSTCPG
jgi:polar amino acid transport system substrate-binding protein